MMLKMLIRNLVSYQLVLTACLYHDTVPRKIHISAEMLTRDPRVLPQEVIDAARKSRKRQPWEI